MCGDCDEAEPLREAYLARRARMAATWTPRRRWSVDAGTPMAAAVVPPPEAERELIAAE